MSKRKGQGGASVLQDVRAKHIGMCPVCGKDGKLDVRRKPAGRGWWVQCWVCDDGPGYLAELAATVGCHPYQLIDDPLTHLGHLLNRPTRTSSPRKSVTQAHIDGWASRLRTTEYALAWLHARGLSDETIREYELGHDKDTDAIVFPLHEAGELVGVKRRYLDPAADPKTKNSPGPAKLYPDVPKRGKLLLVAGELDALIGRQMGLPTVTTTCGARVPKHLASAFNWRQAFVMFDVGETRAAVNAATRVLAYGAQSARVIELEKLGLPHGADLNDFYLAGGTADDIKALIRRTAA